MYVNSNFLNLARIVFSISQLTDKKIDVDISINDMILLNQFTIKHQLDVSFKDIDDEYIYQFSVDTFKLILHEFFNIKKMIDEKNEKMALLTPVVLTTIEKTYKTILYDEKYLFITNTLSYLKDIKINLLIEKLNEFIQVEDYDSCILIKKEINSLKS